MKKIFTTIICLLAAAVMLFAACTPTGAKYSSRVSIDKSIDVAKSAGSIELYGPDWVFDNNYSNNGNRFSFPDAEKHNHIHYQIYNYNTEDGVTVNDAKDTEYYLRIMPKSANSGVIYEAFSFAEYDTWEPIAGCGGMVEYDYDYTTIDGVRAYGPFQYRLNETTDKYEFQGKDNGVWKTLPMRDGAYCVDAILLTKDKNNEALSSLLGSVQYLSVQMIALKGTGSNQKVRILDESEIPLWLKDNSGVSEVDLRVEYYSLGTPNTPIYKTDESGNTMIDEDGNPIIAHDNINNVTVGTIFDFTKPSELAAKGIKIPAGYEFVVGTDGSQVCFASVQAMPGVGVTSFEVTKSMKDYNLIQVMLVRTDSIPVLFQYWDRSQQDPPVPEGKPKLPFAYAATSQLIQVKKGSVIDFTDASTLTAAGINMPDQDNYRYLVSHCSVSRWWHDAEHFFQDRYNVPTDPVVTMAVMDVYVAPAVMRENIQIIIQTVSNTSTTITATKNESGQTQFTYNGVTCTFSLDGKLTIDYSQFRSMFGSNDNYFEVYINNGENNLSVKNVKNSGSITVDYFTIYQGITTSSTGYCLANTKMKLYIKSWGYSP